MDAPTTVLVADMQDGSSAFVKWTAPSGTPQGYNVYLAYSETGTYNKVNMGTVTSTKYRIANLNLGVTIYVKVSAIDENGDETALSAVGRDADIQTGTYVPMTAQARLGDTIAAGSYFSSQVDGGVLVVQVADTFTFDGTFMLWELDDNNYVEFQEDKIVYVLGGVTVAEASRKGWVLAGRKCVLTTPGAVVDATEAPFEWDASDSVIWAIHTTPSDVRMVGIDSSGNMHIPSHDCQPYNLGTSDSWGLVESGDDVQWCNGFYILAAMDKTAQQLHVRGRIVENFTFS